MTVQKQNLRCRREEGRGIGSSFPLPSHTFYKKNNMPVTKSAKKALKKEHRNQARNLVYKNNIKGLKKQILNFKKQEKDKEAVALLPKYYKALDKAAKIGIIKNNNADRKKSRMTKFLGLTK